MAFGWTERGQQHCGSSGTVSTLLAHLTFKKMLSLKEFKWQFNAKKENSCFLKNLQSLGWAIVSCSEMFSLFSTTVSNADHRVPRRQTKHVPISVEAHHLFPSMEIWHISDFLQIIFECVYFIKPLYSGEKKNSPEYYVCVYREERKWFSLSRFSHGLWFVSTVEGCPV